MLKFQKCTHILRKLFFDLDTSNRIVQNTLSVLNFCFYFSFALNEKCSRNCRLHRLDFLESEKENFCNFFVVSKQ